MKLPLIQPTLDALEKKLTQEFSSYKDIAAELAQYAAGGQGKRLRPILVFLSGKLFGEVDERHITLASAIELIHTATLIHDDIIDEAEIRRKKPSLNHAYGPELAVMTGDLILSHAMGLLVSLPDNKAAQQVTQITNEICEGEMLQTFRRFHLGICEQEYLEVIEKKTASLFGVSCSVGAEFSGADAQSAKVMGEFGRTLGIAFQIVDDCLDIVGSENDLGKSLGTDMKKGKLTLPFIRLLAQLEGSARDELEKSVSVPLTPEKMQALQKELREKGMVEAAIQEATQRVAQSKEALKGLNLNNKEVLDALFEVADQIFVPLQEKSLT